MHSRKAENASLGSKHQDVEEKNKHFKFKKRSLPSKLDIYWRYLFMILVLWLLLIQYYERTVVKRAMKKCEWDKWEDWSKSSSTSSAHRVGLFADPQIMDAYSYPSRPALVNWFTSQILDNYHARNWKFFHYYLKPDTVFFLGDLFDGGRNWETHEWMAEYERFNSIFPKKPGHLTVTSLPGNHDIGFGNTIIESSLKRFTAFFGDPNSQWTVGNHTFVLLDTISLSDRQNVNISSVPREFMQNFAASSPKYPRILLTHVPLYRDPNQQQCGDRRESKEPFPLMVGLQYQTVIDSDLSQEVLSTIQPKMVFSGDDHDFCHIKHSYTVNHTPKVAEEITVKSCAMNMGISKPAIQLISLYNPENDGKSPTFKTTICYLPNPFKPLICYGISLALSAAFIFWMTIFPMSFNDVIVRRIPVKDLDTSSLLPIATKGRNFLNLESLRIKASRWKVSQERSVPNFVLNVGVLLSSLFFMFAMFYKGK